MIKRIFLCIIPVIYAFFCIEDVQADDLNTLSDAQVESLCAQVRTVNPPLSDLPNKTDQKLLEHCDSESLYYGIGQPADPIKARLCAFVEQRSEKDNGTPDGFSGSHILMMIYANGRGVHKNIPYAMHLACLSSWAPAEETERLEDLRARQYKPSTRPFDFCDGATSGYVGGICSSHHARLQDVELDRSIIDFQKKLSPNAQKSFQNVLEKQKKWTKKTSENEVDLTGTDRASETIEAEENQKKNFVALLIRLQRSDFPKYTQKDIIKSNAIMKISLAKLKKEGVIPNSTIEWNGISETQKTWERYRDAWGDFAEKVYPAWGKQGAEAWISMERAKMLESMAH